MFKVGLTGGIGSGKTTVRRLFEKRGVYVMCADEIAHQLTDSPDGKAMPAIKATFGEWCLYPDGSLNRRAMKEYVFEHPEAKQQLESILHPLIRRELLLGLPPKPTPYLILDIPLLIENYDHYLGRIDKVCVVDCDVQTAIARVQARDGLSVETIQKIQENQATKAQRDAIAHFHLYNGKETRMEDLEEQVEALHAEFLKWA